nr:BPSS1780 family membrane protein [Thiorhodococcus mannitoliphagus]
MKEETARDLILKGGGRVLKQNLGAEDAERYRAAMTAVGLVITIEPQNTVAPQEASLLRPYAEPTEKPKPLGLAKRTERSAKPSPKSDGSWSVCPKCGAAEVSDLTGVCQACGVVVERYLESHGQSQGAESGAQNPYAPPGADLTPPLLESGGEDRLYPPRAVEAGRGWGWIAEAWELFKDAPGGWIGALLLFYLIVILLSIVPFVGSLATTILGPMLTAGLIMGAHAQHQGEGFSVSRLFAGISEKPGPLALVGVVYLLFAFLIVIIIGGLFAVMIGTSGMMAPGATMNPSDLESMATAPSFLLPVLFALLLGIPLAMAMFFAPALVALNDVPVLQAFKLSFMGCLKNILPFLVYGLVALVLVIVAMLPLMLGLLVVMPLLTIALYTAYRDIFYR